MAQRTAEIAGGGIGGLACAWSLALRGWHVRVHERSPAIRDVGAGIYLMNNSVSLFQHHGIADAILEGAVTLTAAERRERDGSLIQRRDFDPADPWYVLPRAKLVQRLAVAAEQQGVEVLTGSQVTSVTPEGALTLASGEQRRADLVVVADGFRSGLRDQLGLTRFARERNSGATRILVPRGPGEADDVTREYWAGRWRVGITPAASDLTYAYLSCPNRDSSGTATPLDVVPWKRAFPALEEFFDSIPADVAAVRHAYVYASASAWSLGNVAILGDAAHALPPTLAQGAGLSITNGYALAKMLERTSDVKTALEAWEAEYRWISDRTQTWSVRLDNLTTKWPQALWPLRRGVIWAIGATDLINSRARVADSVRLAAGKDRYPSRA